MSSACNRMKTEPVFLIINYNITTSQRVLRRHAPGYMTKQAQNIISQNSLKVETTQLSINNRTDK